MQMKNLSITTLLLLFSTSVWACLPVRPLVIPPIKHDGEFKYIYPDESERIKRYANSKNLAVVKTISTFLLSENSFERQVVELEILHGWGYQKGRYIKIYNTYTPCGLGDFNPDTWNAVIFDDTTKKVRYVIPYKNLKSYILLRGKPEYVYTPMGLMR